MTEADERIRKARETWGRIDDPYATADLENAAPDLFAAVDERDALRARVAELEQKVSDLHRERGLAWKP